MSGDTVKIKNESFSVSIVAGDGDCLFASTLIAIQNHFRDDPTHLAHRINYLQLRARVVAHMRRENVAYYRERIMLHLISCIGSNEHSGYHDPLRTQINCLSMELNRANASGDRDAISDAEKRIEDFTNGSGVEMYLNDLAIHAREGQIGTFGDYVECIAISELMGVKICSHRNNDSTLVEAEGLTHDAPVIHVRHSRLHYDALIPTSSSATTTEQNSKNDVPASNSDNEIANSGKGYCSIDISKGLVAESIASVAERNAYPPRALEKSIQHALELEDTENIDVIVDENKKLQELKKQCCDGNLENVVKLLTRDLAAPSLSPDVSNILFTYLKLAIIWSSQANKLEIADTLLQYCKTSRLKINILDPEEPDKDPLRYAIEAGYPNIVKFLLNFEPYPIVDQNEYPQHINQKLIEALRENSAEDIKYERVKSALDAGANPNTVDINFNIGNHSYGYALHHAIKSKSLRCIELLVERGAVVTVPTSGASPNNCHSDTALHWLKWPDDRDIVRLLILHGARNNTKNHAGHCMGGSPAVLDLAEMFSKEEIESINDMTAKDQELIDALKSDCISEYLRIQRVKAALKAGGNPNAVDLNFNFGGHAYCYAIHHAVKIRSLECTKLLLEKGAIVSVGSSGNSGAYSNTALHWAMKPDESNQDNDKQIVKLLILHGAKNNMHNHATHLPSNSAECHAGALPINSPYRYGNFVMSKFVVEELGLVNKQKQGIDLHVANAQKYLNLDDNDKRRRVLDIMRAHTNPTIEKTMPKERLIATSESSNDFTNLSKLKPMDFDCSTINPEQYLCAAIVHGLYLYPDNFSAALEYGKEMRTRLCSGENISNLKIFTPYVVLAFADAHDAVVSAAKTNSGADAIMLAAFNGAMPTLKSKDLCTGLAQLYWADYICIHLGQELSCVYLEHVTAALKNSASYAESIVGDLGFESEKEICKEEEKNKDTVGKQTAFKTFIDPSAIQANGFQPTTQSLQAIQALDLKEIDNQSCQDRFQRLNKIKSAEKSLDALLSGLEAKADDLSKQDANDEPESPQQENIAAPNIPDDISKTIKYIAQNIVQDYLQAHISGNINFDCLRKDLNSKLNFTQSENSINALLDTLISLAEIDPKELKILRRYLYWHWYNKPHVISLFVKETKAQVNQNIDDILDQVKTSSRQTYSDFKEQIVTIGELYIEYLFEEGIVTEQNLAEHLKEDLIKIRQIGNVQDLNVYLQQIDVEDMTSILQAELFNHMQELARFNAAEQKRLFAGCKYDLAHSLKLAADEKLSNIQAKLEKKKNEQRDIKEQQEVDREGMLQELSKMQEQEQVLQSELMAVQSKVAWSLLIGNIEALVSGYDNVRNNDLANKMLEHLTVVQELLNQDKLNANAFHDPMELLDSKCPTTELLSTAKITDLTISSLILNYLESSQNLAVDTQELLEALQQACRKATISHYNKDGKRIMQIDAMHLASSTFAEQIKQFVDSRNSGNFEVQINCQGYLYLDQDLTCPSSNLLLSANTVSIPEQVLENKEHKHISIDLSGKNAKDHGSNKARNGASYRSNPHLPAGVNGDNGLDGIPGESAGNICICAQKIDFNDQQLKIIANGGKGSNGQDGGDGDIGHNGVNGSDANPLHLWSISAKNAPAIAVGTRGFVGKRGGNGGAGGAAGQGGAAGEAKLLLAGKETPFLGDFTNIAGKDGTTGKSGRGGDSGFGGRDGYDGAAINYRQATAAHIRCRLNYTHVHYGKDFNPTFGACFCHVCSRANYAFNRRLAVDQHLNQQLQRNGERGVEGTVKSSLNQAQKIAAIDLTAVQQNALSQTISTKKVNTEQQQFLSEAEQRIEEQNKLISGQEHLLLVNQQDIDLSQQKIEEMESQIASVVNQNQKINESFSLFAEQMATADMEANAELQLQSNVDYKGDNNKTKKHNNLKTITEFNYHRQSNRLARSSRQDFTMEILGGYKDLPPRLYYYLDQILERYNLITSHIDLNIGEQFREEIKLILKNKAKFSIANSQLLLADLWSKFAREDFSAGYQSRVNLLHRAKNLEKSLSTFAKDSTKQAVMNSFFISVEEMAGLSQNFTAMHKFLFKIEEKYPGVIASFADFLSAIEQVQIYKVLVNMVLDFNDCIGYFLLWHFGVLTPDELQLANIGKGATHDAATGAKDLFAKHKNKLSEQQQSCLSEYLELSINAESNSEHIELLGKPLQKVSPAVSDNNERAIATLQHKLSLLHLDNSADLVKAKKLKVYIVTSGFIGERIKQDLEQLLNFVKYTEEKPGSLFATFLRTRPKNTARSNICKELINIFTGSPLLWEDKLGKAAIKFYSSLLFLDSKVDLKLLQQWRFLWQQRNAQLVWHLMNQSLIKKIMLFGQQNHPGADYLNKIIQLFVEFPKPDEYIELIADSSIKNLESRLYIRLAQDGFIACAKKIWEENSKEMGYVQQDTKEQNHSRSVTEINDLLLDIVNPEVAILLIDKFRDYSGKLDYLQQMLQKITAMSTLSVCDLEKLQEAPLSAWREVLWAQYLSRFLSSKELGINSYTIKAAILESSSKLINNEILQPATIEQICQYFCCIAKGPQKHRGHLLTKILQDLSNAVYSVDDTFILNELIKAKVEILAWPEKLSSFEPRPSTEQAWFQKMFARLQQSLENYQNTPSIDEEQFKQKLELELESVKEKITTAKKDSEQFDNDLLIEILTLVNIAMYKHQEQQHGKGYFLRHTQLEAVLRMVCGHYHCPGGYSLRLMSDLKPGQLPNSNTLYIELDSGELKYKVLGTDDSVIDKVIKPDDQDLGDFTIPEILDLGSASLKQNILNITASRGDTQHQGFQGFELKNMVGEVATGEGKTAIIATLAAVKALLGEQIDIATSSSTLAKESKEEMQGFYDLLGISVACVSDKECFNQLEFAKRFKNTVLYSDVDSLQRADLLTNFYDQDIKQGREASLIIDEFDRLLDEILNTLYLSKETSLLHGLNDVLVNIFVAAKNFKEENQSLDGLDQALLSSLKKNIANKKLHVPKELEPLVTKNLQVFINNAKLALQIEEDSCYIASKSDGSLDKVMVVDPSTGVMQFNSQYSDALHQFLQMRHGDKLTSISLKSIFQAKFSKVKSYQKVSGYTGTLGTNDEQALMHKLFGVDFFKIPRFKARKFFEEPTQIVATQQAQYNEIEQQIIQKTQEDKRAVLVICDNIAAADKLFKYLSHKLKEQPQHELQLHSRFYSDDPFEIGLDKPVALGDVIVTTHLSGRGTDLKLSTELKAEGKGLFAILTNVFEPRVCKQALGRVARSDDPGSAIQIICDTEKRSHSEIADEVKYNLMSKYDQILQKGLPLAVLEERLLAKFAKLNAEFRACLKLVNIGLDEQRQDTYIMVQLEFLQDKWAFWLHQTMGTKKANEHYSDDTVDADFSTFAQEMQNIFALTPVFKFADSSSKLTTLGRLFHNIGNYIDGKYYQLAAECYRQAISLDPEHSETANYYLGYVQLRQSPDNSNSRYIAYQNFKRARRLIHTRIQQLQTQQGLLSFFGDLEVIYGRGITRKAFKAAMVAKMKLYNEFLTSIADMIGQNLSIAMLKNYSDGSVISAFNLQQSYVERPQFKNSRLSKKVRIYNNNLQLQIAGSYIDIELLNKFTQYQQRFLQLMEYIIKTGSRDLPFMRFVELVAGKSYTALPKQERCDIEEFWVYLLAEGVVKEACLRAKHYTLAELLRYHQRSHEMEEGVLTELTDLFSEEYDQLGFASSGKLRYFEFLEAKNKLLRENFAIDDIDNPLQELLFFKDANFELLNNIEEIVPEFEDEDDGLWGIIACAIGIVLIVVGAIFQQYWLMSIGLDSIKFAIEAYESGSFNTDQYFMMMGTSFATNFATAVAKAGSISKLSAQMQAASKGVTKEIIKDRIKEAVVEYAKQQVKGFVASKIVNTVSKSKIFGDLCDSLSDSIQSDGDINTEKEQLLRAMDDLLEISSNPAQSQGLIRQAFSEAIRENSKVKSIMSNQLLKTAVSVGGSLLGAYSKANIDDVNKKVTGTLKGAGILDCALQCSNKVVKIMRTATEKVKHKTNIVRQRNNNAENKTQDSIDSPQLSATEKEQALLANRQLLEKFSIQAEEHVSSLFKAHVAKPIVESCASSVVEHCANTIANMAKKSDDLNQTIKKGREELYKETKVAQPPKNPEPEEHLKSNSIITEIAEDGSVENLNYETLQDRFTEQYGEGHNPKDYLHYDEVTKRYIYDSRLFPNQGLAGLKDLDYTLGKLREFNPDSKLKITKTGTIARGFDLSRADAPGRLEQVGADYTEVMKGSSINSSQAEKLDRLELEKSVELAQRQVQNFNSLSPEQQTIIVALSRANRPLDKHLANLIAQKRHAEAAMRIKWEDYKLGNLYASSLPAQPKIWSYKPEDLQPSQPMLRSTSMSLEGLFEQRAAANAQLQTAQAQYQRRYAEITADQKDPSKANLQRELHKELRDVSLAQRKIDTHQDHITAMQNALYVDGERSRQRLLGWYRTVPEVQRTMQGLNLDVGTVSSYNRLGRTNGGSLNSVMPDTGSNGATVASALGKVVDFVISPAYGEESNSERNTKASETRVDTNLTPGKLLWQYATNKLSPEYRKLVGNEIGKGLVGGVKSGEESTFGMIRKAKDAVVDGYFSRGLQVYERECERLEVSPNITNQAYAAPGLSQAVLSIVPSTSGQFAIEVGLAFGVEPVAASGMWLYHCAKGQGIIRRVAPSEIKFSQSSVNGWRELTESMEKSGWKWSRQPVDVVRMKDGSLISLDNTRVLAAHSTQTEVRAIIRNFEQPLESKTLMERFWTPKNGYPKTWGDAVTYRISKQSASYKKSYPEGSSVIGLGNKP